MKILQRPEGSYTFRADDREHIKARAMLPTDTLRYIEALEAVARAAMEVYRNTPHASKPTALTVECLNDLYDALSVVDFMERD